MSSVSSCPRRKRRTSSPGRARREREKEEEKEEHPHQPSSLAIVPVRKHQKKTIIVATSSLILFTSSLSSVFASSLPFAIKTIGSINHLYSKVSTIGGHLQHLEGHLLGISSWSISNISCSSCWNLSNNIKSIFSKMAGAPSVDASQMHILEGIVDQEEQQIIEDSQPAEEEASPSQERPSSAKPPQSSIKTEHEAKIHIVDSIVYNILASDSTYHTPASESIRRIYDSFSIILAEGVDITTAMGPWDLSHQTDPISLFTVLDNINYEKFIRTGSIILEGVDDAMPYVHRHPHLFQSPLAAINFCIVDHALHRLSGKTKTHQSLVLIHFKLEPAGLIASSALMGFMRPSHPDQELEHLMDHFPNISKYARTSCCLQGPPSSLINEVISSEGFAEYHLLDYTSISGPNHLNIHSAIQLLQNIEIQGKAERFIRTFHPGYISLIKGSKSQHQSAGEGQQWKRHRSASSMATSVDKDGSITINVRYD